MAFIKMESRCFSTNRENVKKIYRVSIVGRNARGKFEGWQVLKQRKYCKPIFVSGVLNKVLRMNAVASGLNFISCFRQNQTSEGGLRYKRYKNSSGRYLQRILDGTRGELRRHQNLKFGYELRDTVCIIQSTFSIKMRLFSI